MTTQPQRKLTAIMFTDLVGYTALTQRNEALALELLEEHRQLLRPLFAKYSGNEIKTIGDAFLVEFASVVEAARCAIAIQESLTAHTSVAVPERHMQVRIGLHVGDVVIKDGDVLGDGVNIASRIEPLAKAGGICVSEDVVHQIENKIDLPLELLGEKELKGIKKPVKVYNLVLPWEKKTGALKLALRRSFSTRVVQTAMIVLVLIIVAAWWSTNQKAPSIKPGQITRLAVLPLANLMNDQDQDYFVDGMHDALLTELSKLSALTVISRQSVLKYKGSKKTIPEIASELQVHALIEGSVLRDGDDVRINIQLIEGVSDRHLWADMFDRKLKSVLALHSDVARSIASAIKVTLTPQEDAHLASTRQVNPETYEAYLKGMFYLNKLETEKGLSYLKEAVEKDPTDPLAYAGLAYGYITIGHSIMATPDAWPNAQAAALKALSLDETLAEGHAAIAMIKLYYEWDWEGAEQAFLRALELNPNHAEAHYHYSWFLALFGRMDEAMLEHKRAQELDPIVASYTAGLGWIYWLDGDSEKALNELEKSFEFAPDNWLGTLALGDILTGLGRYEEAISTLQKLPLGSWALGRTYALSGRTDEAQKILNELENKQIYPMLALGLAVLNAALGNNDEAFQWLAYEQPHAWVPWVGVLSWFEPLRDDPRFKDFLQQMNLPDLDES